jgi:hypothetical protein
MKEKNFSFTLCTTLFFYSLFTKLIQSIDFVISNFFFIDILFYLFIEHQQR